MRKGSGFRGLAGCFGLLAFALLTAACGGGGGAQPAVAASCPSTQAFVPPAAPAPGAPSGVALTVEQINVTLSEPVFLTAPPGVTDRAFIVQKGGVIRILDLNTNPNQLLVTPFLTLTVNAAGEGGLLGLAFHPNYAANGFFYVNMINASGNTEIRRYTRSADPNVADAGSEQLIISIDQPAFTNHKAGWLGFGPDGYLYAALGDGGGGGDPLLSGQDLGSLLGKMLRLDVNGDDFPGDATRNYAIPADNPCVGQAGARGEIWSMGLRNPWRNAFDRGTGDLYIADVGQGLREEVNVATASGGGGRGTNYGWNITEGTLCFLPASGCNMAGLQLPAVEYPHSGANSGCSITGGFVYRGSAIPALQGTYFYADFCQGFVRSFRLVNGQVTDHFIQASLGGGQISSFGEDGAGELYIMTISGGLRRIIEN